MKGDTQSSNQIGKSSRVHLLFIAMIFVVANLLSLAFSLGDDGRRYEELARNIGDSYFESIVTTRGLVTSMKGLYAVEDATVRPNEYLKAKDRDLTSLQGIRLTKLNPSYFTRLLGEYTKNTNGVDFHLTSLKPLRPQNVADDFETLALTRFEKGDGEFYQKTVNDKGEKLFRFMRPLVTEKDCLECHAEQGYQLGDLRGGISITFPFAPFEEALQRDRITTIIGHMAILILGLCVFYLLSMRLVHAQEKLLDSEIHIKKIQELLPVCAWCKSVKIDDKAGQKWVSMDIFIAEKSHTAVTHDICPECSKKLLSGKD